MYYFHLYWSTVLCSRPTAKALHMWAVLRQAGASWEQQCIPGRFVARLGPWDAQSVLPVQVGLRSLSPGSLSCVDLRMPTAAYYFLQAGSCTLELLVLNLPVKSICHLSQPLRLLLSPSDLRSSQVYYITASLMGKWTMIPIRWHRAESVMLHIFKFSSGISLWSSFWGTWAGRWGRYLSACGMCSTPQITPIW